MRFVLDTSVIVAAVRSSSGASSVLVDAALARRFELLVSVPLVLEYEAVLMRPEQMFASKLSASNIEQLLLALLHVGVKVDLEEYLGPTSNDPGDNHLLSLAVSGHADAIVTHNIRHVAAPSRTLRVHLFTPGGALTYLRT
jgi:putative PIN family toxin of toxin-antitoxin system